MEEKEYIIFHSTLTPLEGGGPLGRSSPICIINSKLNMEL